MRNEILKSLWDRKSVRIYEDREIPAQDKREIIEAAIQAPTAGNMSLYTLIDVTDPKIKQELSVLCDNQPFIAQAPLILIFLADWQKWFDGFCLLHGEQVRSPASGDLWLALSDSLIAAQNSVVAAESLGIGSCYIGDVIENCAALRQLLNLPPYAVPAAMLCYGYPTEQQKIRPKPQRRHAESAVFENGYRRLDRQGLEEYFSPIGGFEAAVDRVYLRKWTQPFMQEMTASFEAYLKEFQRDK